MSNFLYHVEITPEHREACLFRLPVDPLIPLHHMLQSHRRGERADAEYLLDEFLEEDGITLRSSIEFPYALPSVLRAREFLTALTKRSAVGFTDLGIRDRLLIGAIGWTEEEAMAAALRDFVARTRWSRTYR